MAQAEDADRRTIGLDRGSGSAPYWDFVEAENLYTWVLNCLVALTVTAPLLTVAVILVNPSHLLLGKPALAFEPLLKSVPAWLPAKRLHRSWPVGGHGPMPRRCNQQPLPPFRVLG